MRLLPQTIGTWLWYEWLIVIYIALVGFVAEVHGLLIFIAFYGLYIFAGLKANLQKDERLLLLTFFSYFVIGLISFVFIATGPDAHSTLEKYLVFLWAVPIYMVLRESQSLRTILAIMPAYIAIAMGIAVCVEFFFWGHFRPQLFTNNPLFLGYIAASLSLWSLIFTKKQKHVYLSYAGIIFGLLACLLTGTRGALLGWLVGLFVILWQQGLFTKYTIRILLGLFVLVMFVLSTMPRFTARIESMIDTLSAPQIHVNTSTGKRISMWRAGWDMFKEHPLTGVGIAEYQDQLNAMIKRGEYPAYLAKYDHPHNSYISNLASTGIFGLIAVIALFYVPYRYFKKVLIYERVHAYALSGQVFVSMMAVIGLTESIFERQAITVFYVFFVLAFYAVVRQALNTNQP